MVVKKQHLPKKKNHSHYTHFIKFFISHSHLPQFTLLPTTLTQSTIVSVCFWNAESEMESEHTGKYKFYGGSEKNPYNWGEKTI
jgi:hypothetical protein